MNTHHLYIVICAKCSSDFPGNHNYLLVSFLYIVQAALTQSKPLEDSQKDQCHISEDQLSS